MYMKKYPPSLNMYLYVCTYIHILHVYMYTFKYMHTLTDISKGSLMTPPQNQDPLDKVNCLISSNIRQQVYM
jgi:hypothetical protein